MGRRNKVHEGKTQVPVETKRQRVARAELTRVEEFLRTAATIQAARTLTARERELVSKARRLRRTLYARLGPKQLPVNRRPVRVSRPVPAGGVRSVVSGGLPG
jgi:hypothetical protein